MKTVGKKLTKGTGAKKERKRRKHREFKSEIKKTTTNK
jgi:hypothetical protein